MDITIAAIAGRPVTSAGTQTPLERAAFVCLELQANRERGNEERGQDRAVTGVLPGGGASPLRRFAGACTIRLACQAAEANHPDEGREGSPLKIDNSPAGTGSSGAAKHLGRQYPRKRWQSGTDQTTVKCRSEFRRTEGLSVSNRCLAPEPHQIKWRHSPRGS